MGRAQDVLGRALSPHGYANTIHAEWSNLQGLADTLYKAASNTPAETKAATACEVAANNFLREFDACDYNLYVGFQGTNASIGDKIDLHYDINGPGVGPISATPRGTDLFNALNFLETNLGMSKTSAVESVDKKAKITWQKNSGAGSATTIGWVNIA